MHKEQVNDILLRLREPKVIDPARGTVRQASALECEAAEEIERLRDGIDARNETIRQLEAEHEHDEAID